MKRIFGRCQLPRFATFLLNGPVVARKAGRGTAWLAGPVSCQASRSFPAMELQL